VFTYNVCVCVFVSYREREYNRATKTFPPLSRYICVAVERCFFAFFRGLGLKYPVVAHFFGWFHLHFYWCARSNERFIFYKQKILYIKQNQISKNKTTKISIRKRKGKEKTGKSIIDIENEAPNRTDSFIHFLFVIIQ
jgi:hypothetical protein